MAVIGFVRVRGDVCGVVVSGGGAASGAVGFGCGCPDSPPSFGQRAVSGFLSLRHPPYREGFLFRNRRRTGSLSRTGKPGSPPSADNRSKDNALLPPDEISGRV
ncbi:MAG: hypothetical protein J1E02_08335 [Coprobacter sp.]|nr:hypothetical protein [Coprobacter sp.]